MPDEPNAQERKWDALERDALSLLTDPRNYPTLWSVADLGREIDYFDPDSVIRPLCGAGLVHRLGEDFVFATAAGYRAVQIIGHVV